MWQRSTLNKRGHRGHISGADEHWKRIVMLLLRKQVPWIYTSPPILHICKSANWQLYRNPKPVSILSNLNLKLAIIQEGGTHGQQRFSTSLFSGRKASIIRCRMGLKCKESHHCCRRFWEHPNRSLQLLKDELRQPQNNIFKTDKSKLNFCNRTETKESTWST